MARTDAGAQRKTRKALSHDLLHGLSPEEFDEEAKKLADMGSMTPAMRERLKAQLVERLKTPVDKPSWGPDWRREGEKVAGYNQKLELSREQKKKEAAADKERENYADAPSAPLESDDAIIARNMEKSRQVAHYKPLYIGAAMLALVIVLVSMFVDYHIIREVWTRALANEFMVVPPALQASVMFKSLQVVFAVLIVHFMLKITGAYGRSTMIAASFVMAMMMIAGLGYLTAYNNMEGGTATAREQSTVAQPQNNDSIQQLFASDTGVQAAAMTTAPVAAAAPRHDGNEGVSIGLPKLSDTSLAHADKWFWYAFASFVFFIVTTVAALYMQTVENNVRNVHIANDYRQRRRDFALLHLLEHSESRGGA
jgi:hypothetical protein